MKLKIALLILLMCGCSKTPESAYKSWRVTATSNGGVVRYYEIRSVDKPIIEYGWKVTTVYSYNENAELFEFRTEKALELPDGWLIEIRPIF